MPQELIAKYNERHHTNIDAEGMIATVSSLLVAHKEAEMRDEMLKKYLMESYSEMAAQYQYDKMSRQIREESTEGYTAAPQDLLGEYIGIFTVVVNTVSEQRLKDAKQAAIDAKEATERAFQAAEDARNAYNNSLSENNRDKSRNLKDEYEKLEKKYQTAKANETNVFTFEKYTPTMRNFTLTSNDVKSMMESQMAGYTFKDYRRHQLKTLGVRNPLFRAELPATGRGVHISDLKEEEQQKLMETWVTKQLMQEELDSRSWWSKNIWNRGEAKAMREYIGIADSVIYEASKGGDPKHFENMVNNILMKGYEKHSGNIESAMEKFAGQFTYNNEPVRQLEIRKERIAEENRLREEREKEEETRRKAERKQQKDNDKKLADEKAKQRDEQKALWESKKAAFKPTIDAINAKNKANEEALNGQSLYQRLQDPKFMPSFNPSRHLDEVAAVNKTASILKKQNATVALDVVKKNADKLKLMHQFIKMVNTQDAEAQAFIDKANEVYEGCKNIEAEQEKLAVNPNYAKVENVEELIAAAEKEKAKQQAVKGGNNEPQKESVQINPEQIDGVQSTEVSPVHEEKIVSQDPLSKSNL